MTDENSTYDVPSFDDSEWPIFLVTQPRDTLTIDAHRAMLAEITTRAFGRKQSFVLLIDATVVTERPDALRRKLTAAAMRQGNVKYPGILRGLGVVLRSTVDRHVLTALTWLARPPYPMAAFETISQAKTWARQRLSSG